MHRSVQALRPIAARANRSVVDTDRSVPSAQLYASRGFLQAACAPIGASAATDRCACQPISRRHRPIGTITAVNAFVPARARATGFAHLCIAMPSLGGDGVAGHSAPDLPTHRIAASLHSPRRYDGAALYANTRFPTGCVCTDRCKRCDRSLRVSTDKSWTQTDRYHRFKTNIGSGAFHLTGGVAALCVAKAIGARPRRLIRSADGERRATDRCCCRATRACWPTTETETGANSKWRAQSSAIRKSESCSRQL